MSRPPVRLSATGALRCSSPTVRAASPLRTPHDRAYSSHRLSVSPAGRSRTPPCHLAASKLAPVQLPVRSHRSPAQRGRGLATAAAPAAEPVPKASSVPTEGPLKEYDDRVREGRLRDDLYQRGTALALFLVSVEEILEVQRIVFS